MLPEHAEASGGKPPKRSAYHSDANSWNVGSSAGAHLLPFFAKHHMRQITVREVLIDVAPIRPSRTLTER